MKTYYAFQYWNGGMSALYKGKDAINFVDSHYASGTYASIVYGNNPKIEEAYNALIEGGEFGFTYISGDGSDKYYISVEDDKSTEGFISFSVEEFEAFV